MMETKNCWTCRHVTELGCTELDKGPTPEIDEWVDSEFAIGEDMPPRETAIPCPGWDGEVE